jgi:RimJ/RimL family protein N-acetyltransferase
LPDGPAIGVADGGTIVGGFVYTDFDPDAGVIEIHGASAVKNWLTRPVLYGLFSYPFDQLGCQMVAMRISADDKPLRRMLMAYGFKALHIPRLFGRNADGYIMTLTDDDWRCNRFHKQHRS